MQLSGRPAEQTHPFTEEMNISTESIRGTRRKILPAGERKKQRKKTAGEADG